MGYVKVKEMNKVEVDEIVKRIEKFNEEWENDPNTGKRLREARKKHGTLTTEALNRQFTI